MLADLTSRLRRHGRTLLDVALPAMCPACGDRLRPLDQHVCERCWERIGDIRPPVCSVCGLGDFVPGKRCPACLREEIFYSRARQAAPFAEPLSTLVDRLKYGHTAELAQPMARLLARQLKRDHAREKWDLIVPVPLHRVRERERGYNQSALITRHLGKMIGWPVAVRAMVRHRRTKSQTRLGRADRMRNVVGAFSCPEPALVAGKRILLLDDVYTTGSTMNESARALIEAGAESVFALAVARAMG